MKTRTWLLVANRTGAKLYQHQAIGDALQLVEDFENPDGKLLAQELVTDRPGSSYDSDSSYRHSYSKETDPTRHAAEKFAKRLGERLNRAGYEKLYERLVIAAEASFLGELRPCLDKHSTEKLALTVNKDLLTVKAQEIPSHLGDTIRW